MARLDGKVAIVTGGASGIGRATAQMFAREGARVLIADIDAPTGCRLADELRAEGHLADFVELDVTSAAGWSRAAEAAIDLGGKLTCVVNNAGVTLVRDVEQTTLEEWHRVMDIHATGAFLGTQHGIAAMKTSDEDCSIINRSSIDSLVGEGRFLAYSAAKGAITSLTKAAAMTCADKGYGIRVNTVHPGYIRTPLVSAEPQQFALDAERFEQEVASWHPLGRLGEPDDVAHMDVFLASEESSWVTGAEFVVDGGYTAR